MIAIFRKLLDLGTHGHRDFDIRRLRSINAGALAGMVVSSTWLLFQAANLWIEAVYNLAAVIMYASVLVATSRARVRAAAHLLLLTANAHILVLTVFGFGGTSGGYLWAMALALGPWFVLGDDETLARWGYCVASMMVGAGVELHLVPMRVAHPLTAEQNQMSRAFNLVTVTLGLVVLTSRFIADIRRAEAENDRLLHNILPPAIAERLRASSQVIADNHAEVTVVFADIVGFTSLAQRVPAEQLVQMLNEIFSLFDDVADELGLEKIKTIGDAYMVAAGVPVPRADHALASAEMAVRMREIVATVQKRTHDGLEIRIGIHSGPVVAGVIGKRKFAYDLWGDVVNTAARMESHGVPGEIQVSEASRQYLEGTWQMEPRGRIPIKGKGELETFLLRGRRT